MAINHTKEYTEEEENENEVNEVTEEESDQDEAPTDEATEDESEQDEALTDEANVPTHFNRYGCCYCLITIVVCYICIVALGCYFMYLGRFSLFRGFAKAKRSYNSLTMENLGRVATGRDIIYID